jgi:transposase InsO family protein
MQAMGPRWYTKEFREEAVKLATAVGASEASRRLSVPLRSLANRLRASRAGKLEEIRRALDTAVSDAGLVPGCLVAPPAVIQHTDRGSQYCSHEYRALVAWFGMQASMRRAGAVTIRRPSRVSGSAQERAHAPPALCDTRAGPARDR